MTVSIAIIWTNPTMNTDGTPIQTTGPSSITGTVIQIGTDNGGAFGTLVTTLNVTGAASNFTTALNPGTYSVRAATKNAAGSQSGWSAVVTKVVAPPPIPEPPVLA